VPVLTIFAGPNGSGKSSITARVEFDGRQNLLESDAIAKTINRSDPSRSAVAAAREVIRRTQRYIERKESFAIETTLAGNWVLNAIRKAKELGFFVRLVYICVDNPERSIQRVRERVALGGHHVPDQDVRRRYERSLSNLSKALKIADQSVLYDNSGIGPRLVVEMRSGIVVTDAILDVQWAQPFSRNTS
jgi:predicted ABC-type ATPase